MTENQVSAQYQDFIRQKATLEDLIMQQIQIHTDLAMTSRRQEVEGILERLRADSFKVLVMGEFKRGKSTFINALLGKKVLPAFAIPTTAIINEVKLGHGSPRAKLHYLPTPNGLVKEPMEIPIDQIEEYVVIKNNKLGVGGSTTYESPYEKVELFWPLDLCRDGVEIIDSPGLNEDVGRQKITLEYLKSVDVVLYMVACDFPVSMSELQAVQSIKDAGHEQIFFICNRINMIEEEEVQQVKDRCVGLLAPYTKEREKQVIFLNARGALTGRMKKNPGQVSESNILEAESKLKTFLADERGRLKLLPPAHRMRAAIRESWNALPILEKLYRVDLETLQARNIGAEKELSQLEDERGQIREQFFNFRREIAAFIYDEAVDFYNRVSQEVEQWTRGYALKNPRNLNVVFSGKAREQVAAEVIAYLSERVRERFQEWKSVTIEPYLKAQWTKEMRKLDQRTKNFAKALEQVRIDLVSDIPENLSLKRTKRDDVSTMERILESYGGRLGDVRSTSSVTNVGVDDIVSIIIPQLALAVLTGVFTAWNPIILIPVVLFGGTLQAVLFTNPINKKIRDVVGQEYAHRLQGDRYPLANQIRSTVDEKLMDIQESLNTELMLQVQNVRDQINAIFDLKEKEEGIVEQKLQALNLIAQKLNGIENELDMLTEEVSLGRGRFRGTIR